MAALVASVPLPLLLDSFLASSWTWVALSLATIATLLRALSRSCVISRHRPQALLPPPPCIVSSEREHSKLLHPLPSIQERGIQSIPALENLLQRPDALTCPELGFFSCMHACNHAAPLLLADVGLAPKICSGQPCSVRAESSEGALGLWPQAIDYKLRLRLRVGFLSDAQKSGFETPEGDDGSPNPLWTSSDAYNSSFKPLQNSSFDAPRLSSEVALCFEMQFGWHKLLDTRWGAPWRTHPTGLARALLPYSRDKHVVKVWSTPQRNLFKALKVEESSVAALDVNIRAGFAYSACRNGEVSRWDISNQARLSGICSSVKPISALCSNSEKGVIVTGNGQFLRLWDHRSPSLFAPILDGVNVSPCSNLRCDGDVLWIDRSDGIFSSCDLRKPQGKFLSMGAIADSEPEASNTEEDESSVLWEKLSCDEDEFWDEYHIGFGDALQKRSSFTSRCATLVRSLSSSGR